MVWTLNHKMLVNWGSLSQKGLEKTNMIWHQPIKSENHFGSKPSKSQQSNIKLPVPWVFDQKTGKPIKRPNKHRWHLGFWPTCCPTRDAPTRHPSTSRSPSPNFARSSSAPRGSPGALRMLTLTERRPEVKGQKNIKDEKVYGRTNQQNYMMKLNLRLFFYCFLSTFL